MFGMWIVQDVGYLRCVMFKMLGVQVGYVWNLGCSECEMFQM